MDQPTNKQVAIIGKQGTVTVFQLFGFRVFEIDTEDDIQKILEDINTEIGNIGMILLTSDVALNDRQQKKLNAFELPVIILPMHKNQTAIGYQQMEKLIDKAVGMKLNFLKTS